MPVLSGYEVAREIRRLEADERRAPTPILAVSASVMRSEIDSCLEAGMNGHIAKPIDPAALFDAMRSATSKAASEAQAGDHADADAPAKSAVA
jgi:CheY-like chemotaxis protein